MSPFFASGGQSIRASGLISFKMDWFDFLAVQESSPTPQFKSINSLVLRFLYGPALTSIHAGDLGSIPGAANTFHFLSST